MALPNPGMAFSPFDILTAEEMNDLVENIEALAAGTGLNDGVVTSQKLNISGTSWSPTITGFSSNPANGVYTYIKIGRLVTLFINQPTNGTSNSGTIGLSLPFPALTLTNRQWSSYGYVIDNGAVVNSPAFSFINSAGTTLTITRDAAGNVFTTSGGKRVSNLTITYEASS